MDPLKFVVANAVELESGVYRARIVDENNQSISGSVLTSFTLTLYDQISNVKINARDQQNALNANQVTVDGQGNVEWIWLPADMQILNPNRDIEIHVAMFEAKWLDGASRPRQLNHEVHFYVNRIKNAV